MDIIPGKSIGEFTLGQIASDHELFPKFNKTGENKFQWKDISLRINENGAITLISTKNGDYRGITTGKTFKQIIEAGNKLLIDDFDQIFYLKEPEGLCIEKEYENLNFNDLLNSKIQFLTVFDVEYSKKFGMNEDFEEINHNNISEFEKKGVEFSDFIKNSISDFRLSQDKTKVRWWKIW